MTDLFILLAAVTCICTGAAVPCFFKSSRNTAGCLILSAAVLAAAAACFVTPVKDCFAAFSHFDAWYFGSLFAAAFVVSLFYRPLLGVALILYALWCSAFLLFLLPAGFSPSGSVGEITVSSNADQICTVETVTMSPYHLLPFGKVWYQSSEKQGTACIDGTGLLFLKTVGAVPSSREIALPVSATYPHVYFLSISADGSASFETIF